MINLNVYDQPLFTRGCSVSDRLPIPLEHQVQRRLEQLLQGLLLAPARGRVAGITLTP